MKLTLKPAVWNSGSLLMIVPSPHAYEAIVQVLREKHYDAEILSGGDPVCLVIIPDAAGKPCEWYPSLFHGEDITDPCPWCKYEKEKVAAEAIQ